MVTVNGPSWPFALAGGRAIATLEHHEEFVATLAAKPVHHTLANHWARIIELVYAAEQTTELAIIERHHQARTLWPACMGFLVQSVLGHMGVQVPRDTPVLQFVVAGCGWMWCPVGADQRKQNTSPETWHERGRWLISVPAVT